MKVLFVNNDKGWGGGQEYLKGLATQLVQVGIDARILCRGNSPSERKFLQAGLKVYGYPATGRGIADAMLSTARLLKREVFDIVMVSREHDLFRTFLAWKLAFPLVRKGKFVMCYHTATCRKQLFLERVDAVVCVSNFVRDVLLSSHPRLSLPVAVLHNGIPVNKAPVPEKFSIDRDRRFFKDSGFPLIGMVGAFFKNQAELLEIIPLLKESFPTLKVALVGDDSDAGLTAPLLHKLQALGVSGDVIITGKVPHERLNDVYFDFDLSVSTFRKEGFGLVFLESLAAGTPVISYNEGGQTDIFSGNDTGILIDGGPDEFAKAVVELLRDHKKRFAMGQRGAMLVRSTFSVPEMGLRYQDFFGKLIRGDLSQRRNSR